MSTDRKKDVQNRLKQIAEDLKVLANSDELSEEQEAEVDALQAEGEELEIELSAILSDEKRRAITARATQLETSSKASQRLTTSTAPTKTRITNHRLLVEDDPNRGFKSMAEYFQRVQDGGGEGGCRKDEMLINIAAGTGMQQSFNSTGGVLVPPGYSKTIWDGVIGRSNSLLDRCMQLPIDPGLDSLTINAIDESSRANGSRWGGVQGYWKAELTQMQETRPKLREVTVKPQELYVFAYISDKLLRNAPVAASALLEQACTDEIAFKIGDAIINNSAAGAPIGIVGHASTVSVAAETGQGAGTILRENVNKMYSRMHSRFLDGAVFFCNQEVVPALEDQAFSVGTSGVPVYIPPGGQADAPLGRLKGKPLVPIEYCAALGTVGDLIFANLGAYCAAVKGMVDRQYSMHLKFDYAQTAFRLIFEMDGQPMLNTPITPYKGSSTYSPFVTLATR